MIVALLVAMLVLHLAVLGLVLWSVRGGRVVNIVTPLPEAQMVRLINAALARTPAEFEHLSQGPSSTLEEQ